LKIFKRASLKNKSSAAYLDTMREIDILKELNHPNIIKLYEVIDDEKDDKLYLVLDYAEKG
jgi:serine/threonine protein kinase